MAICMKVGEASHIHEDACDESSTDGHGSSTVVAVRLKDDVALQVRHLMENSPRGYESISAFFNYLVETQALRRR